MCLVDFVRARSKSLQLRNVLHYIAAAYFHDRFGFEVCRCQVTKRLILDCNSWIRSSLSYVMYKDVNTDGQTKTRKNSQTEIQM